MPLYAITILVGAFLLFQVQPMIAKLILPWFGGAAGVWTTCLLFFQIVLLGGYLYAHWLNRTFRPRVQALIHAALLFSSLLVLPIIPAASWKPAGTEDPTWRILGLLTATVGLPYFLLSTTGPLLQSWYAQRFKGSTPYRLYALSNAGSMFALLSYPVLFEPVFSSRWQALGWSAGFAVFVVLCGSVAILMTRVDDQRTAEGPDGRDEPPDRETQLFWISLPACASVLLLAVTSHLSQNVAAIPFLWVLPLSLYLLSFILCFESSSWYWRNIYLKLFAVAAGGMAYALGSDFRNTSIKVLIPLFAGGLFICCIVLHGELVRLKPDPRRLTAFYLMISLGGALGGVIVGLVAPRLFRANYELPAGLAVSALVVVLALSRDGSTIVARRPVFLGLLAAVLAFSGWLADQTAEEYRDARVLVRNFYGGLRVTDSSDLKGFDAVRTLTHGTINHGEQFLSPLRRDNPTTYYGPDSGIGLAIRAKQSRGPMRVGVIGLGTGTLAAYGRPGDYYRFYEINPLVIRLAQSEFTFLRDSKAQVEVALGDARLSLEREESQQFDVLAVDAFSSDAIPVHLLTREAFGLYFRHLKPDGVLAVHISNRYLDLKPVVKAEAQVFGRHARLIDTQDDPGDTEIFGSSWVLTTSQKRFFDQEPVRGSARPLRAKSGLRLWTDDYSNLFQILK